MNVNHKVSQQLATLADLRKFVQLTQGAPASAKLTVSHYAGYSDQRDGYTSPSTDTLVLEWSDEL